MLIVYLQSPFPGTVLVIVLVGMGQKLRMLQTDSTHRLTVLLADESEGWVQTVRGLLAPQGVQTVTARNGREALQSIESGAIHVAVLDQQMPQLNGLQVIRRMRELPTAPPAILLADHLTNHLLHEALGMKVFSVLGKPVDFNLLLDSLARVLRRYHESRWPKTETENED